jgi:hypothetical protein
MFFERDPYHLAGHPPALGNVRQVPCHIPRVRVREREKSSLRTQRRDGKRFVVRADEKLTAFVELESATRSRGKLC